MSLFSFFRSSKPRNQHASKPKAPQSRLERLEDRLVMAGNIISGYVYHDLNNNGIKEAGEAAIANTAVELRNANNIVVATDITDANGYYEFTSDKTINSQPQTLTKQVVFPLEYTNWDQTGFLDMFDTSLGELTSVDITLSGSITSEIQVENTSTKSLSMIKGTVGGSLTVTGPNGLNLAVAMSENVGQFAASQYDGTLDFGGSSGKSFPSKTVQGGKTITLTGAAMEAFKGTGKMTLTGGAETTSTATGGGNLLIAILSEAESVVTVVYHYTPKNDLKPGPYTIYETQPAGFTDGKESSGGVVLPHAPGTDFIEVNLVNVDLNDNNFGELKNGTISGFVYFDANNNGIKDAGETGIAGAVVNLSGTDDAGNVSKSATTDATGFYQFVNLKPGTYNLNEIQPADYIDGKDAVGSLGGTLSNDAIASIVLPSGGNSIQNNFGEIRAAAISGFVYVDSNNNGVKDGGEAGIANVHVTLTHFSDVGPVTIVGTTDASGFYQFVNLKPGTYALLETQPTDYLDGKDNIGTQGGTLSDDQISQILLNPGTQGQHNNFGELLPSSLSGFVYVDTNNNGVKDPGELGIAGVAVQLSGTDEKGNVQKFVSTDANGFYKFDKLRPGTYQIIENQPPSYLDGKDAVGSQGGSLTGSDTIGNIGLGAGVNGVNNNFGELQGTGLSGFVYVDKNDNGIKDAGEAGIQGVTVTLNGFDDFGPVSKTVTTDAAGFYQFANLRPGTYVLLETQPTAYKDGKDTIGSQGGLVANDQFSSIVLAAGVLGVNNNFGEIPFDADIGVVKVTTTPSVLVGGTVQFTMTVTNYGEATAQNVRISDTLPSALTYISAVSPGWTFSHFGGVITGSTLSLAKGQSATILVTAKAPNFTGTFENVITVTSDTPDNNPNNNTSKSNVTVTNTPGDPFPKTVTPFNVNFRPVNIPIPGKRGLVSNAQAQIPVAVRGAFAFADGAYQSLMGTTPDAITQYNLGTQVALGQLSRAQLIANLWNTDQHRGFQADNFYRIFLDRAPSASERAATIAKLKAGVSEYELAVQFLTSNEYLNTHVGGNALATGLYQDILGRNPDVVTLNATVSLLDTTPWETVVRQTLNSVEARSNLVDDVYRAALRRPATASEIQYYSGLLISGALTPGQLTQQLLASNEFYNLALSVVQ